MYLNYKKQRGSALVIAVFVIVVMLALAVGLSRLLVSSSETVVYEVQGTRAFFAAQSGLELALTQLFPLGAPAATSCPAGISNPVNFSDTALNGCRVIVNCNAYPDMFWLSSRSECTANEFTTSRTVQIEVRK
ncbi:PilX N-terminal domain-containing pilus assembly protein [Rheinheimera oceanensis]|uniref:PilX N-terminal domain-containing pilus assembly protein n=1 Tax=Rheinheimera oceanensis TaxID=2817449 RepID=UPI001BFD97CE|nr:PilX N-terminal domain-containing pilus assembly protein [Rheinheimera oceanensis]